MKEKGLREKLYKWIWCLPRKGAAASRIVLQMDFRFCSTALSAASSSSSFHPTHPSAAVLLVCRRVAKFPHSPELWRLSSSSQPTDCLSCSFRHPVSTVPASPPFAVVPPEVPPNPAGNWPRLPSTGRVPKPIPDAVVSPPMNCNWQRLQLTRHGARWLPSTSTARWCDRFSVRSNSAFCLPLISELPVWNQ